MNVSKWFFKWCLLSVASFALATTSFAQTTKVKRSCPSDFVMHKDGADQVLRYAASHSLDKKDTLVRTLIVYVHGVNRNAMDYFDYAEDMVSSARQKKQTLIIAPQYADEEDLDYYRLKKDFLFWKKAEWKDGYNSMSSEDRSQGVRMSSYEVLDSMLVNTLTSGKFPNIKRVVIAGHSAGGQFVQRYSVTTPLPGLLPAFSFRFIIMDPSSYLYLDGRRPAGEGTYAVPDASSCPEYNNYPKGLEELNTYAKAMGPDRIRENMLHRDLVVLLGAEDTRTDDPNLDVTCAGNLEGPFRLERGLNFVAYLKTFPGYNNNLNFGVVKDTGHNGDKMINSDEAGTLKTNSM